MRMLSVLPDPEMLLLLVKWCGAFTSLQITLSSLSDIRHIVVAYAITSAGLSWMLLMLQYWEYIIEKAYEIHAEIYRGHLRWCLWLRRWRCSVYWVGLCLLVYFYLYFVYYCLYSCSLPVYILVNKAVYIRSIQEISPRPRTRKRKVFSVLVVISVVGTISEKSLKLLPPVKMRQIRFRRRLHPKPR